jgi:hypothetical protein
MTPEWEKHLKATEFLRSKPHPRTGEVSVFRRLPDGELRFERVEKVQPPAASLR